MKKVALILCPLLLLGSVAGLALTGIIKIPGFSPKSKSKATQLYTEASEPKIAESAQKPIASNTRRPQATDAEVKFQNEPEVGRKKLAKLWNEVEAPALLTITKDWSESELAAILLKMDSAKVAELLGILEPKRASQVSRELQRQASLTIVKPGT